MNALGEIETTVEDAGSCGSALLEVHDLKVTIETDAGPMHVVRGVSFQVLKSEFFCVVGESGSGKSVTFLSILGLLPTMVPCKITGDVRFGSLDLRSASRATLQSVRGRELSIVFQDPLSALNPVFRIGEQIANVVRAHDRGVSPAEAMRRAVESLELVRIPNAAARAHDYPHQFSGGMRQRVLIAMAIVCRPKLLIADEPTTALDVTVQAEILALLNRLRLELSMSVVLITHDLGLVARYADRVAVMYAGRIIEQAGVHDIFAHQRHPYTDALLRTLPRIGQESVRLVSILGEAPNGNVETAGCAFEPRCGRSSNPALCATTVPALLDVTENHAAACYFPLKSIADGATHAPVDVKPADRTNGVVPTATSQTLLQVRGLCRHYVTRAHAGRGKVILRAVDDVSFELSKGETLGIVGESGSGKSTLARCILQLVEPTAGEITFDGQTIHKDNARTLRMMRDRAQLVFQDARAALNPRMTIEQIVGEPLVIRGLWKLGGRERVLAMLAKVGLTSQQATRFPHEFSGGQQQRVGIARALIMNPALVVLDEPISSLDVSIRAQIINLLEDLQEEFSLSYLFIAHDLSVVHHISDRVAVMYHGQIVEVGSADAVCETPLHPYTQMLVAAVPEPDPLVARRGSAPAGIEPSRAIAMPTACPFALRCPLAQAVAARGGETIEAEGRRVPRICMDQRPPLQMQLTGTSVACHFAGAAASDSLPEF
jgi:peptide/nickel transport system ATP-binding protein